MKSVEELLLNIGKFGECVIPVEDSMWSFKLSRVCAALHRQRINFVQSHTTELDIWVYITK